MPAGKGVVRVPGRRIPERNRLVACRAFLAAEPGQPLVWPRLASEVEAQAPRVLGSVAGMLLERAIRSQVPLWTPQTRRVLAPMLAVPVVRTHYAATVVPDALAETGFPQLLSGWRRGRFPELDPLRGQVDFLLRMLHLGKAAVRETGAFETEALVAWWDLQTRDHVDSRGRW